MERKRKNSGKNQGQVGQIENNNMIDLNKTKITLNVNVV